MLKPPKVTAQNHDMPQELKHDVCSAFPKN